MTKPVHQTFCDLNDPVWKLPNNPPRISPALQKALDAIDASVERWAVGANEERANYLRKT